MKMTASISKPRSKLGRLIEEPRSTGREIVIAKRGVPAAVLMDYVAYMSRKETTAVLADRALMKEVRRGIRDLKTGKARFYTLDELFSNK